MKLNISNPLAFFDLESTGTNIAEDRIIEYTFIKLSPNGNRDEMHGLLNPEIPIPNETSLIHGIYDEDVKDAPKFREIAKNLAKFLEGCDLAGFSIINFDIPILVEEFLRVDIDFDITKRKIIDSQKIFHLMEKRNLKAAYRFYCNKELEDAHTSKADTLASIEVLESQVARYEGQKANDMLGNEVGILSNNMEVLHQLTMSNKVDLAGRLVFNREGDETFNFGKYKGKPVSEIFEKEPQYYDWIMKGSFPMDTKKKVTEIKLRNFGK